MAADLNLGGFLKRLLEYCAELSSSNSGNKNGPSLLDRLLGRRNGQGLRPRIWARRLRRAAAPPGTALRRQGV
jgi:hypothetical protein